MSDKDLERARHIVCSWKFKNRGCDCTTPFSDHALNPLAANIAQLIKDVRDETIDECADLCSARWNFLIESGAKDASITTTLKLRNDIRALKGGGV